jgi:hypothetical protein
MSEFGAEFQSCVRSVAGGAKSAAIIGMHLRQIGVQLQGALEVLDGGIELAGAQLHRAEKQLSLGGFAVAQNAIENQLRPRNLAVVQQGGSQQEGYGAIVRVLLWPAVEQRERVRGAGVPAGFSRAGPGDRRLR